MDSNEWIRKTDDAKYVIDQIVKSDATYFDSLLPSHIELAISGVYFIATKKEVLYVGKSSNLRRRIYTNQLQGNETTARLKKYLIDDVSLPKINTLKDAKNWMKANCYFKMLQEEDIRKRAFYECVITYYLSPKYINLVR